MIYLVMALYCEAEPFIRTLSLKKELHCTQFQIFSNDQVKLILTNQSSISAAIATTYLLTTYPPSERDIICNLGCCATTDTSQSIGTVYICNDVIDTVTDYHYYPDLLYLNPYKEAALYSVPRINRDIKVKSNDFNIIDMEGAGFFESARLFFSPDRICLIKCISDYLASESISEAFITELIQKNCTNLLEWLYRYHNFYQAEPFVITDEEQAIIENILTKLNLSVTLEYQFLQIMKYIKLTSSSLIDILSQIMDELEELNFIHKREGKIYFEQLRQRLLS